MKRQNRNCIINGKEFYYTESVKEQASVRKSFNELADKTFGLSFENWYRLGYWRDAYIPHVLLDHDIVAANISVNVIDSILENRQKRYIQIGTVMTDERYRHQGLSRFLMETVLQEWIPKCDGIYLYANDGVIDFYPRFHFRKAEEYQYSLPISGGTATAGKLNMEKGEDVALLLKRYQRGNPFSRLPMLHSEGLLMFYCAQFMKDSIYDCQDLGAIVIADFEGETMTCYDIFGGNEADMLPILHQMAGSRTKKVVFGFTPKETDGMQSSLRQENDTTLFWYSSKECIFNGNRLMFPILSHA